MIQFTRGSNFPEVLIHYRHHEESKSKKELEKQEHFKVKISAKLLENIFQIPHVTNEEMIIIGKIINLEINALKKTDLEKVNESFFVILEKFRKNISSSKMLINDWEKEYMLPLIIQLETILINTSLWKEEDRVLYINYLFKLSFLNKSVWFMHLLSEIKLLVFYPFWLIHLTKYLVSRS